MRRLVLASQLLLLSAALAACGDDTESSAAEAWACSESKNLSERCEEGEVVWCHAVGTPHFHGGAKCALAQYSCIEVTEDRAVCSNNETCADGDFRCEGNTAINCVQGVIGLEPCGTRKKCLEEPAAALATCWDDRAEAPCSGHGALYEDGCVCDRGYTRSGDGESCSLE